MLFCHHYFQFLGNHGIHFYSQTLHICISSSYSRSLPTRQVQMFDVAIPLVVALVLSAFYILPPSSSPASFVLIFLLIFFLAFSLRLPFSTVVLLLECVRSTSFVWFLLYTISNDQVIQWYFYTSPTDNQDSCLHFSYR